MTKYVGFNSTLVQLKDSALPDFPPVESGFNSTLVQLKVLFVINNIQEAY